MSSSLSLGAEVVLLAPDARRRRLHRAVEAAARADSGSPTTVSAVIGDLEAGGLVRRAGWRRIAVTDRAPVRATKQRVGQALLEPRTASPHDLDLAVLLLVAGALPASLRTLLRGVAVGFGTTYPVPPATAWLLARSRAEKPLDFVEGLLRKTRAPETFGDGAFDPGVSDGVVSPGSW